MFVLLVGCFGLLTLLSGVNSKQPGQGYQDSINAALSQGDGKSYEEMKDFIDDGDYIGCQVIQLDDGTIIVLDDEDVHVIDT